MVGARQPVASGFKAANLKENELPSGDSDHTMAPSRDEPKAKRQRIVERHEEKGGTVVQKATGKRRRDLSLLPTMPLDILFEVLGHLKLKDLLNLGRVNKSFRKTMIAPSTNAVWIAARRVYHAPDPPKDFSEARWAGLLFEFSCQLCGNSSTKTDWGLLKRLCSSCKREHYVTGSKLGSLFPEYDSEVLSFLPFTQVSPSGTCAKKTRYFWDKDLHATYEEWSQRRRSTKRGAKAALKAWQQGRIEMVDTMRNLIPVYEKFVTYMKSTRYNDREQRCEGVKARFLNLGYESVDIDRIITVYSDGILTGAPVVTNTIWKRLQSKFEPSIEQVRNKRMAAELRPAMEQRLIILNTLYMQYLAELKPSERYMCPPVEAFQYTTDILAILETDKDTIVTAAHFQPIVDIFPEIISRYWESRREVTRSALDISMATPKGAEPLDLARYVFLCSGNHVQDVGSGPFIGWPMIASHTCSGRPLGWLRPGVYVPRVHTCHSNKWFSQTAHFLIKIAGFNPANATIDVMDDKDPRYVCSMCLTTVGYEVFTWRGAIFHQAHSSANTKDEIHDFRQATDEETEAARAGDTSLRDAAKAWSCNHCCDFLEASEAESKPAVLEHLASAHGIGEPKLQEDYFLNERCRYEYEAPFSIPLPDVVKYVCPLCPRSSKRRFNLEDTEAHWERHEPYYPQYRRINFKLLAENGQLLK